MCSSHPEPTQCPQIPSHIHLPKDAMPNCHLLMSLNPSPLAPHRAHFQYPEAQAWILSMWPTRPRVFPFSETCLWPLTHRQPQVGQWELVPKEQPFYPLVSGRNFSITSVCPRPHSALDSRSGVMFSPSLSSDLTPATWPDIMVLWEVSLCRWNDIFTLSPSSALRIMQLELEETEYPERSDSGNTKWP